MSPHIPVVHRVALASITLTLFVATTLVAQDAKRPINEDDYDKWTSIRSTTIRRRGATDGCARRSTSGTCPS